MIPVPFIHGTVAMGCMVAAIFFLRYWQQSRDRLLLFFALAFALIGSSYTLLGIVAFASEWRVYVYIVRLLGFCLILYAIIDKNRR